jgi:AAA domain/Primase C terminal 2 (PriCT-2)/Bifunctional DNA primase/polymerase, N-terminal
MSAAAEAAHAADATALRLQLLAQGYEPIPVVGPDYPGESPGKGVALVGWTTVEITPALIESWQKGPRATDVNTGMRGGRLVIVDVDVLMPDLADELGGVAASLLGPTPLERVGKAPKRALCYRTATPMPKIKTPTLVMPDGRTALVEVLGQGQQAVGFGIHPETRRPYRWVDRSPLEVRLADLPEVQEDAVRRFIATAEDLLRAAGGRTERELREAESQPHKASPRADRSRNDCYFAEPTYAEVADAMRAVPNTHDWAGWVKIGAAIYDALADDGENLFTAWSEQSSRNDAAATRAKWRSFRTSPMDVKAASLFWEARRNGWLPERERVRGATGRATEPPADRAADEPGPMNEAPSEQEKPARGTRYGKLVVLGLDDLDTAPARGYIIKGIIAPNEISLWVGAPKCGKSFLLLHVSYMLALGRSVFGRRVKPVKVLYVAAEGEGGIANRIKALRSRYGSTDNFRWIAQPADLLHHNGHLDDLIEAATALGAGFVPLDTLSRMMAGGDENSPVDMGQFVANVTRLRVETTAHIAIVHHGTKASNGSAPRGHSSLTGADDALIEVAKLEDGTRTAVVVHSKDDADGDRFAFGLEHVELGIDDDGDPITTLIVEEKLEVPAPPSTAAPCGALITR